MPMSFKHYISFDDDKISFNNMLCFSISNVPTATREAKSLLNVCCALKILRDIPSTLWCWIFRCVFRFQPQHLASHPHCPSNPKESQKSSVKRLTFHYGCLKWYFCLECSLILVFHPRNGRVIGTPWMNENNQLWVWLNRYSDHL